MISDEKLAEAYSWESAEVEARLPEPEFEEQLVALLGREGYEDARRLIKEIPATADRGRPGTVLIVPGVVGSKLGDRKRNVVERLLHVIWLNPLRIVKGDLMDLKVVGNAAGRIDTYGVFLKSYERLKLSLERAGWNAEFCAYDWRLPLAVSCTTLIGEVARWKARGPVHIVAHSMGGLLVRAALQADPETMKAVTQIITLGTPHQGSFSPVPLLRGIHSTLKLAAGVDLSHSAEELARDVFATMPGFYELLPNPAVFPGQHLFDMARWPTTGVTPQAKLLEAARMAQTKLAPPDNRFHAIVGHSNPTLSSAALSGGDFKLRCSKDGDGAVLYASSEISGVPTWYTDVEHGELANGEKVRAAVIDLLDKGTTKALPTTRPMPTGVEFDWSPKREARSVRGAAGEIDPDVFRRLLDPFDGDARGERIQQTSATGAAKSGAGARVVNQMAGPAGVEREPPQFELRLFHGSIAEASARAYAVGVFDTVKPAGAAAALDAQMDGALGELYQRNMVSGALGWINAFPGTRRPLRADLICLVGLGRAGDFTADAVAAAAANLVRYLIQAGFEDCAVVPFGAQSQVTPEEALNGLVRGALQAICEADRPHFFRGLTICEIDAERFKAIEAHADVSVNQAAPPKIVQVRRITLPDAAEKGSDTARGDFALSRATNSVTISVTGARTSDGLTFTYNLVPSTGGGTAILGTMAIEEADFEAVFAPFRRHNFPASMADIDEFGAAAWATLVPERVRAALATTDAERLIFSVNRLAARIPWETMHAGDERRFALRHALSRRHASDTQAVGKWIRRPSSTSAARVLLVINPTLDLPGAQLEGDILLAALQAVGAKCQVDVLRDRDASRDAILAALGSGKYDILHYAGHASYDAVEPQDSGIYASDGMIQSGDIASLAAMPALVVLNACESARVRQRRRIRSAIMQDSVSFAEAILDSGIAGLVGTYWPVSDDAAKSFAEKFYAVLLRGEPVGQAVYEARQALFAAGEADWADYLHFGDHDFAFGFLRSQ